MPAEILHRQQVEFDVRRLRSFYQDKRVLVTGAAGSIGSALCTQLADLGCAHLSMVDQFDHGLLTISEAVQRGAPRLQISDSLCDIRDEGRLAMCMSRLQPDVVIHAAALKHVHMGERHPDECVLTNLVGVRNALSAAVNAGAQHFMLISSDKAAAPTCVMGATKRLAELYLAGFQLERSCRTRLRSVRFGNVIGSQGSVLPRFLDQIASGGPLEVTHESMARYFMTDEEAVGLILSVTAMPDDGDPGAGSYFMEMGELVSIMELGRALIRQSGRDVPIEITGLRPGEKLTEELFDEYEQVVPTSLPNVFRIRPEAQDAYVTSGDIAELEATARTMEHSRIRQRIFTQLDQRLKRRELLAG